MSRRVGSHHGGRLTQNSPSENPSGQAIQNKETVDGDAGTSEEIRRRDQPRFDQLFAYAREHTDASGLLNHQNPLLPALLSIDLEQESRLDNHKERLEELEEVIESNHDQ